MCMLPLLILPSSSGPSVNSLFQEKGIEFQDRPGMIPALALGTAGTRRHGLSLGTGWSDRERTPDQDAEKCGPGFLQPGDNFQNDRPRCEWLYYERDLRICIAKP